MTDDNDEFWNEHCAVIPPEELRFFLVGIVGTIIASTSFIFNAFLFFVLIAKKQNRRSHFIYLIFLAFIDTFLSASYILLFSVNIFMDQFESELLAFLWWNYLRAMLMISHVAITSSALLLSVATFERFITIYKIRQQFPLSLRLTLTALAISFSLLAKAPMFFELNVVDNENCTGIITAYQPQVADWSEEEPYKTVYKFCFRTIVSTFLPFLLSLYFNMKIVSRLQQQITGARLFRFATSEHRKNIRSTTRMLAMITTTYLACNILSVFVASVEFVNKELLMTPEIRPLYTYSSDLISLLTVFSCASRLPIYYFCNRKIRRKVNSVLRRLCFCDAPSRELERDNSRFTTMRCLNAGNGGYILYEAPQNGDHIAPKSVLGTSFDKVVLQVAMGHFNQQHAYARRVIREDDV